ncbi:MAG: hypothetical protein HRF49_12360 [bacterium]
MRYAVIILIIAAALAIAAGCGNSSFNSAGAPADSGTLARAAMTIDFESAQVMPPRPPRISEVPRGTGIVSDSFEMIVINGMGSPDPGLQSKMSLETVRGEGTTTLFVKSVGLADAYDALFIIRYDPAKNSYLSTAEGDFLGGPGETITLFYPKYGEVHCAVARIRPDENGTKSGEGLIAALTFANSPERKALANPYPNTSKPWNKVDPLNAVDNGDGTVTLTWVEKNVGDYNNNGEVSIADVTPIALNFNANTTDGQGNDPWEQLIDGDKSGEVGVSDITPIALNWLNTLVGYNIYRTTYVEGVEPVFGPGDKLPNPINPGAPATVVRDGIWGEGQPPNEALTYLFNDELEVPGSYVYVVRPVSLPEDSPNEGLDSALGIVSTSIPTRLELFTEQPSYVSGNTVVLEVRLISGINVFSTNCRLDYDPAKLQFESIAASLDGAHPNYFPEFPGSLFFGVQVDSDTIGFNNTQKKGQPGIGEAPDGATGTLAYVTFTAIGTGDTTISFHDPSNFIYLRSPNPDFSQNLLPFGLGNPLQITITSS